MLPAGRLQGALLRHRLPLPPRHRPHLLLRQPDQRRRAGRRGRRERPLRPPALRARHRRVLPRPAVRRAVGRPPPVAEGDLRLPRPRGAPHRRPRATTCRAAARPACHRGVSDAVDGLVAADESRDSDFARVASEMRLVKDDWEVAELQTACDITTLGFDDSVAEWDRVLEFGERWVEGTFFRRARAMGNDIGYDSIVGGGAHATTLHWIDNTGPINARRAGPARHGRRGPQPLHRRRHPHPARSTAPSPRCSASSTTSSTPRRRPGSRPYAPARRSSPRTTPRWTCWPTGSSR